MGNEIISWLVEGCAFATDISSKVAATAAVVKTLPLVAACKLGMVFETLSIVVTFGLGAASGFETLPLTVKCGLGAAFEVETLPLVVICGLGAPSEAETLPLGVTCALDAASEVEAMPFVVIWGLDMASGFAIEVNILLAGVGWTSVAVVVCEVWSS